jgi:hypothetical protein
MITIYVPKKIKANFWLLVHPIQNAQIGPFKSRKAAYEYQVKTFAAIINH